MKAETLLILRRVFFPKATIMYMCQTINHPLSVYTSLYYLFSFSFVLLLLESVLAESKQEWTLSTKGHVSDGGCG